jgi:hypothetical protein
MVLYNRCEVAENAGKELMKMERIAAETRRNLYYARVAKEKQRVLQEQSRVASLTIVL